MRRGFQRVMNAMLQMNKLDIGQLKQAYGQPMGDAGRY